MQIDKGAIPHCLGGASIMAPGLISKGGYMDDVNDDAVVGIYCEDKVHPFSIGLMKLSA